MKKRADSTVRPLTTHRCITRTLAELGKDTAWGRRRRSRPSSRFKTSTSTCRKQQLALTEATLTSSTVQRTGLCLRREITRPRSIMSSSRGLTFRVCCLPAVVPVEARFTVRLFRIQSSQLLPGKNTSPSHLRLKKDAVTIPGKATQIMYC